MCTFYPVASLLGDALGLVGGGETEEDDESESGLDNSVAVSTAEEEKQLQNMMYNLMVRGYNI